VLADEKYLKDLQLKEQEAEKRMTDLLKKLDIPD
jgi:hypothetical protein